MQRIMTATLVLAMLAGTILPLAAQTSPESAFRAQGFTVVRERSEGGIPTWDLRDAQDRPFVVSLLGSFTPQRQQALSGLRDVIFQLPGLDIQRLRFVFERDRADAVVIPAAFDFEGEDYAQYMPSGMQFQFDGGVSFDFRMLVDNLAVRINGQFLTTEQFMERIQRAVENPAAYIQSQDPQFLARRLDDQLGRIEQLEVTTDEQAAVDRTLQRNLQTLERAGRSEVSRLEERIAELEAQTEALQSALDSVDTRNTELAQDLDLARQGAVILATRNLFGSLKVVDPALIVEAVGLRAAEPDLSQDELLARVNASLDEGVEPLHSKHIVAIDAIYFNRFE